MCGDLRPASVWNRYFTQLPRSLPRTGIECPVNSLNDGIVLVAVEHDIGIDSRSEVRAAHTVGTSITEMRRNYHGINTVITNRSNPSLGSRERVVKSNAAAFGFMTPVSGCATPTTPTRQSPAVQTVHWQSPSSVANGLSSARMLPATHVWGESRISDRVVATPTSKSWFPSVSISGWTIEKKSRAYRPFVTSDSTPGARLSPVPMTSVVSSRRSLMSLARRSIRSGASYAVSISE